MSHTKKGNEENAFFSHEIAIQAGNVGFSMHKYISMMK
jgi:hypothetical protein